MFAVMRHRDKLTTAKFASLHPTIDAAVDEAKRLTQLTIAEHGFEDAFCYYVVQIVGRVGIINGALQSSH